MEMLQLLIERETRDGGQRYERTDYRRTQGGAIEFPPLLLDATYVKPSGMAPGWCPRSSSSPPAAAGSVFVRSGWQRCRVHFMMTGPART
jgi:hypothetical protein